MAVRIDELKDHLPDPILTGFRDANGKWTYGVIDPLATCPDCGYAEGAHNGGECPDEATTKAWWGR